VEPRERRSRDRLAKAIGLTVYFRVSGAQRVPIQSALDAGADAVIVPQIRDVAHAREAASYAKYPPLGTRGIGHSRINRYGGFAPEFLEAENRRTQCIVMIETQEAFDDVEHIAAVPGIDGLFIGPGDLSLTRGRGLNRDTPADAADHRRIVEAARAAGKAWSMAAAHPRRRRFAADLGAAFITRSDDLSAVRSGLANDLALPYLIGGVVAAIFDEVDSRTERVRAPRSPSTRGAVGALGVEGATRAQEEPLTGERLEGREFAPEPDGADAERQQAGPGADRALHDLRHGVRLCGDDLTHSRFAEVRQGAGDVITQRRDLGELRCAHHAAARVDAGDVLLLDLDQSLDEGLRPIERLALCGVDGVALERFDASPDSRHALLEIEAVGQQAALAEVAERQRRLTERDLNTRNGVGGHRSARGSRRLRGEVVPDLPRREDQTDGDEHARRDRGESGARRRLPAGCCARAARSGPGVSAGVRDGCHARR
jgi:4-hydroxy-2-oxoheptanedioate aldolase